MSVFEEELKEEIKNLIENVPTLFKYIDFKGGFELLDKSTLLIRNPSFFNDPYDCYPGLISFDNIPNDFIIRLINKYYGHLSRNERRVKIRTYLKKSKSDLIRFLNNEFISKEKELRGIACFTKDSRNLLMWSQYSDSHKGICIGFNLEKLYRNIRALSFNEIALLNVKYTEKLEANNYFIDGKKAVINWLRTKSESWEYENEIRISFSPIQFENKESLIIPFDKSVVDEILLGSKIKEDDEGILKNMLYEKYPNAKVYKMELSDKSFSLEPKEI